jgi:hypothetical protein
MHRVCLTNCTAGTKRRLSSSPRIRPFWSRKEDAHCCNPQRTLWPWCRKDQDRCACLPNHYEPQTRVQHRRFCIPPRDHAIRCRKLRQSSGAGLAQGGSANTASRLGRKAALQGCRYQRGRPSDERRSGSTEAHNGEIQPKLAIDFASKLDEQYHCPYQE